MKKIEMHQPIFDLNGDAIKDQEQKTVWMSDVIARALVEGTKGDTIKFYDWAMSFKKVGFIEVDDADFETLENFVRDHQNMVILVKGQILKELKKLKD